MLGSRQEATVNMIKVVNLAQKQATDWGSCSHNKVLRLTAIKCSVMAWKTLQYTIQNLQNRNIHRQLDYNNHREKKQSANKSFIRLCCDGILFFNF